jgi:hypothetical protein
VIIVNQQPRKMGASQSSEEESQKGLWYKPSPTTNNSDLVFYFENVKERMASHVDIEERLEKISIYRMVHTSMMVTTGGGQPKYYIFLKSARNFWTLDRADT